MSVLTLQQVTATEEGFRAEGTVDVGATPVLSLQVSYKATANNSMSITGASQGLQGTIRIDSSKHGLSTGDIVLIEDVRGTVEANGDWRVRRVTENKFDLRGSVFQNAYTSGGKWILALDQEKGVLVAGDHPPASWSIDVKVERNLEYEVHATLFWGGSPPIIRTESKTVDLRGRD